MKNKQSKGLSLSANPKHLIKGAFFAVTEVFADYYEKISKFYHTFKWSFCGVNDTTTSKSYLDLSAANSPSIQSKVSIFLKLIIASGFSANGLASKAKNDGGVVDSLTENSNSVRECDGIFKRRVQKEYTSAKIPSRHRLGEFSLGRSMIEMLGVLAIIAVLSVGGIAGYSKAMEKWKINKTLEGYSYLTQGLLGHIDDIRSLKTQNSDGKIYLADTIQAMNLLPEGWKTSNNMLYDTTGNYTAVFSRGSHLVYDINLGTDTIADDRSSDTFSDKLCVEFFNNFVQPLHSSLQYAYIFRYKHDSIVFYGDTRCGESAKCLRNMTLSDMHDACNSCTLGTDFCLLTLEF